KAAEGACKPGDAAEPASELDDAPATLRALHRLVRVGFSAPPAVARLWRRAIRATQAATAWAHDEGECVHLMLIEFAHANAGERTAELRRRHATLDRDGYACMMPSCRS